MKTYAAVPQISTLVEMTAFGERYCGVRIDDIRGSLLDLSLPTAACDALPGVGDPVTLRWPAGPRGRYAVQATVLELPDAVHLQVTLDGAPVIEQHRRFVRGGGGEEIRLHRSGDAASAGFAGWLRDISERGVRAQFDTAAVHEGDSLQLHIRLGHDTVDVCGTAHRVSRLPATGRVGSGRVDIVAHIDVDEVQAQIIRRYVLRQQMLARARTGA